MSAAIHTLPFANRRVRPGETPEVRDYVNRAEKAAKIAEQFAAAVDRDSRFPQEAFEAIREQRLLGMLIPTELGGGGCRAADVADVCAILGAACSSTGMIFAMHQVKVACLVRHDRNNVWLRGFLKDTAREQWLLASSTTEGGNGADIRNSEAAVKLNGARVRLERDASVISYGANADAIVTTARRADAAASSDQVLAVFRKSDYTLEKTKSWDTLGMRGTCSVGYLLRAEGDADQVLTEPYERIHNQTMMPYAHLFWASTWQGIASGAFRRARAFVRQASRASGGRMPPGAPHLTRARVTLETLRGAIQAGLSTFERNAAEPGGLTSMNAQLALNFLKVEASELAATTVMSAMRACGLSGYRNDSDYTMGRFLRDILSAPIMIHNDRILSNSEAAVLMSEPPLFVAM
jgi:acyl-CoA dehydrogenase